MVSYCIVVIYTLTKTGRKMKREKIKPGGILKMKKEKCKAEMTQKLTEEAMGEMKTANQKPVTKSTQTKEVKNGTESMEKSIYYRTFTENNDDFNKILTYIADDDRMLNEIYFKMRMRFELIKRSWEGRLEKDGKFNDWLKLEYPSFWKSFWGFSSGIALMVDSLYSNKIYKEPYSLISVCKSPELYKILRDHCDEIGIDRLEAITRLDRPLRKPVLEDLISKNSDATIEQIEFIKRYYTYETIPIINRSGDHFINWNTIKAKMTKINHNSLMGAKEPDRDIEKVFLPSQINKLAAELKEETFVNDSGNTSKRSNYFGN